MDENRIILVDKPAGISSFGVVAKVRGYLRATYGRKIKVGHTGTLDPFATGLLILLSGKMTKKSGEFLKLDKVYEATLKLGYTSTTGDPEGEISQYDGRTDSFNSRPRELAPVFTGLARFEPAAAGSGHGLEFEKISSVLAEFIGKITQTPPKYSAIKINGQRAYKLARRGEDFEMPSRGVEIYSIEILEYKYPELTIRCHVSSGTYIRTLAEDIGAALGTGAYLTALRRISIGKYNVAEALPLSHFMK